MTTVHTFEQSAAYRGVAARRMFYLLLALLLDLLALSVLACLRIDVPAGAGEGLWGFDLHFEPFALRAALWMVGLVVGQIVFGHWAMVQSLKEETNVEIFPRDNSNAEKFGELTADQIVAITHELADSSGVRRPDRLVIQKQPIPNAFTGSILGYGTVLVLHSNLLEIMTRSQIRAIIAHEIGHIRRWDSFINQIANLPRTFLFFVQMVLFFKICVGLWHSTTVGMFLTRLAFLIVGMRLLQLAFGWMARIGNLAMQQAELLCDGYAAQACGPESVINALLRLGERSEALTTLIEAIVPLQHRLERPLTEEDLLRLLSRFPPGEMSSKVARETAAQWFVLDQLFFLKEKLLVPLPDDQVERLAHAAAIAIREEDAKKPEAERPPEPDPTEAERLLDWRRFDLDNSDHLDRAELARLVADLRNKPERMIFRQFLQPDSEWKSHPSIRHRLLFVYETFLEAPA